MVISRRQLLSLAAAAAASSAFGAPANGFVRARGKELIAPDGNTLLLKGINLGNWLEPEGYMFLFEHGPQSRREIERFVSEFIGPAEAEDFWAQYRKNYITAADIDFIRRCGFNSVRIPFHWNYFVPEGNGYDLLAPVIEACRAAKLWVILDMHAAPGGQTGTNIDDSDGYPWLFESARSQQQFVEIWASIAKHYSDDPIILGYDLLNEPIPHFPQLRKYNSRLEPLYKRATEAIRRVDRNHVIILGGAQWDTNFDVFGAPFDDNLLYQLHKYWMTPDEASIKPYLDFRDRYNVPIWLGESGENTDDWVQKFRTLLEQHDIGWCFWPYKKMLKESCIVSINKPGGWDSVIALASMGPGTGNAEKRIAARPEVDASRRVMQELLQAITLRNCRVNAGYLKALGMNTPAL